MTTLVEPLFRSGGPAQIAGLIASVIVSSVQGVFQTWALTNVFAYPQPKSIKVTSPFWRHANSPIVIVGAIFPRGSNGCSTSDIEPCPKQIRSFAITRNAFTMRSVFIASNLLLPTAAGFTFSLSHNNSSRDNFTTAIAPKQPKHVAVDSLSDEPQTDKSPVAMAGYVCCFHKAQRSAQYLYRQPGVR